MSRSEKILRLNDIRKRTMEVMAEKGFDGRDITFERVHEFWRRIPGDKKLQSTTAVPSDIDNHIRPDPGYDALSDVNISAAPALKPYNIPKGQTIFGIEGVVEVISNDDSDRWITLWDGRITTTKISPDSDDQRSICEFIDRDEGMENYLFDVGDTIRITVDGVSAVYVAITSSYSSPIAGNEYISDSTIESDHDDGFDYAVGLYSGHDAYIAEFFSRYPGTYNVKIELKKQIL